MTKTAICCALICVFAVSAAPATAQDIGDHLRAFSQTLRGEPATWSGRYAGVSVGYTNNEALYCDGFDDDAYDCNAPDTALPKPQAGGVMFGFGAGQNWQRDQLVYGIVGDVMGGNLLDVVSDTSSPSYECRDGCGLEVTAIAMLRGRVGYAMGDALPHISAGFAITRARVFEPDAAAQDGVFTNAVIGVGIEYQMSKNVSAGIEVLQFLEGDDDIANDGFCDGCAATSYAATLIRTTVSYRF